MLPIHLLALILVILFSLPFCSFSNVASLFFFFFACITSFFFFSFFLQFLKYTHSLYSRFLVTSYSWRGWWAVCGLLPPVVRSLTVFVAPVVACVGWQSRRALFGSVNQKLCACFCRRHRGSSGFASGAGCP